MKQMDYTPFLFVLVPVRAVLAQQQRHIIRIVVFFVFMTGYLMVINNC